MKLLLLSAILALASAQQNGDVRLEGDDLIRGRLEIFLNKQWGNICFDHLNSQRGVAQTACRQLGFNDYKVVDTANNLNITEGTLPILLNRMYCSYKSNQLNAAQHILRCDYYTGSHFCTHEDDMAIECDDTTRDSFPYDTMVDILNEDTSMFSSISSGYAQVYLNEQWGPVCNMKKADADSFCRQLSYTSAVSVEDRNSTSDREEVLDSFDCFSSQDCLRRCFNYPKSDAEINCDFSYSFVTCTYRTSEEYFFFGSESSCTISNGALIAGIVVGSLLATSFFGFLGVVICCCVPGCLCHKEKRRVGVYSTSGTKYDAI